VQSPAEPQDLTVHPGGRLAPGEYYFSSVPDLRVVFTVGSGWEKNIPDNMIWTTEDDKATMGAGTVENLYVDPCQPELGLLEPAVGPTVDDLAAALEAVPGLTFSAPAPVTQDGASGVRLDYVPPDEFGDCASGTGDILLGITADGEDLYAPQGEGAVSYYIYDVDGTRVLIFASPTDLRADDLDAVLASIRFE
jgi:hypothetical protein